jgi:mRNA interferase MazF
MKRGEIWYVDFDPSQGDEIQKTRPAVIVSIDDPFRQRLHIVVPITSWQPKFHFDYWMVRLPADVMTGLKNESAGNTFQVKSLSDSRFKNHIGNVSTQHLAEIVKTVALCIGFNPQV